MEIEEEIPKKDSEGKIIDNEYEKVTTDETLNTMIPIWKKNKSFNGHRKTEL